MEHLAYLALGSNLGDKKKYLAFSIDALKEHQQQVIKISSIYNSKAYQNSDQPDYLNQVVAIKTLLSPQKLLDLCLDIEQSFGRTRIKKWESRTIDIDIMYYDDIIVNKNKLEGQKPNNQTLDSKGFGLIIPHHDIKNRAFLMPMADIAPDHIDPIQNQSIEQLLNNYLSDHKGTTLPDKLK